MGKLKIGNNDSHENIKDVQILTELGDLSYTWWPEQQKLTWNGNLHKFLHSSTVQPFTARSDFYAIIHPADLDRVQSALEQSVKNKTSYNLTYRVKGQKGYFAVLDKGTYCNQDDGEYFQAVLIKLATESDKDASEPEDTSQDLILKELEASKTRLDNIITHSSSLFYSHLPDGTLTYVSPQSRQYFDCEPEEAMIRWQEFVTDNPENNIGIELTTKAIQTGKKQSQYYLELVTKKARKLWVRVDESPVVQNGKTIAIVGSLTDVTQQRLLKNNLQTSNDELKTINTQLARTKDGLFAQTELLNNIIENLPVGLQLFDENGYSLKINKKQQEILGLPSLAEGIGKFNVLTDPYSKANGSDKRYQKAYKGKLIEHEFEFNFGLTENQWNTRSDKRILRETIFPVFDSSQKVSHVVALLADVTTQRLNEQLIKENEKKLRQVLESSPIAMVLHTKDGQAVTYNKKFSSLFGYTLKDIPTVSDWYNRAYPDPEYREQMRARWKYYTQNMGTNEVVSGIEATVICKNGDKKDIEFGYGAIDDLNIVTFVDITERNNIRDEIVKLKDLLAQNEHLCHVGAWEYKVSNQQIFWTDGLYDIHDFDKNKTKNHIEESLKCYSKKDREIITNSFKKCIEQGEPYDLIVPFETVNKHKWIRTITLPVYSKEGQIKKIIGSVLDITEHVERENKLKELNATKDKLFSIIGHDLKNPIGGLIGISDLAIENLETSPREQLVKYLELIKSSGQRSYTLLSNLLDWAYINTGKFELDPVEMNLFDSAEEVFQLYKSKIYNKKIRFENHIPEDFVMVADEQMMETILRNLLSNAAKFTGGNGQIKLSADRDRQNCKITISDTGTGISKQDLKELFEPSSFISRAGTNQEKGSGLGLKLCNEFVKMHGGTIDVQTKMGQGTTFHISIPIIKNDR